MELRKDLRPFLREVMAHNAAILASRDARVEPGPFADEQPTNPGTGPKLADRYVLLVEDDEDIGGVVFDMLEDAGYQVKWVTNGVDALDFLKRDYFESQRESILKGFVTEKPASPRLPSLVLLDLMLKVVNGRDAQGRVDFDPRREEDPKVPHAADYQGRGIFRFMKQRDDLREIPVVVMSADVRLGDFFRDDLISIQGMMVGPEGVLPKPFVLERFLAAVRQLAGPPPHPPRQDA